MIKLNRKNTQYGQPTALSMLEQRTKFEKVYERIQIISASQSRTILKARYDSELRPVLNIRQIWFQGKGQLLQGSICRITGGKLRVNGSKWLFGELVSHSSY
jgi:hypothetical protein